MKRGNFSRTLPIILVVIIMIVAIVAIISLGRAMFGSQSGSDSTTTSTTDNVDESALLATDTTRSVRFTQRGPIVANENFRTLQIVVSPDSRSVTAYEGYLDNSLADKSYSNNTRAYEQFVYALDKANMMKGTALSGAADDTRGLCATGNIYEYEILQAGRSIKRLWTTDCDGSKGSLDASTRQLNNLFFEQVPDSNDVVQKAGIGSGEVNLFSF